MLLMKEIETAFCEQDSKKLDYNISAIGDLLAYSDLTSDEVIKLINFLLEHIKDYSDTTIIENILNVCLRTMNAHKVFSGFDLDIILPCWNKLDAACFSYILSFWGFSGKVKYIKYIQEFLATDYLKADAEEALNELNFRLEQSGS